MIYKNKRLNYQERKETLEAKDLPDNSIKEGGAI